MEETEEINFVEPSVLDWIEAVLVLVISSFGFLINTASLFVMVRSDSFRNAFGYITAYQALCRASLLLIFAVWATPWTLLFVHCRHTWFLIACLLSESTNSISAQYQKALMG
ncbi:hypothetical protein Y032_0217g2400 [Ancylostoma ceylanicum]|uniref:7TM GPCR serpentine receptor class x (Srx) domain-containing protein n=1 Tax=Ancylostoma ceylanicum TaxID=53326 RepID=A0A016SJT3_9BILA|nr:hypothetical protein Y032_0217g2400 [Ancylostoma ceylanicum]